MSEEKQTLSPTEWKSVTEYVIELSQRLADAVSPDSKNGSGNGIGSGEKKQNA
jgi:hypothetical protein